MIHFLSNAVAVLLLVAAGLDLLAWAIDRLIHMAGMGGLVFELIRESCRKEHAPWWLRGIESTSGFANRILNR